MKIDENDKKYVKINYRKGKNVENWEWKWQRMIWKFSIFSIKSTIEMRTDCHQIPI